MLCRLKAQRTHTGKKTFCAFSIPQIAIIPFSSLENTNLRMKVIALSLITSAVVAFVPRIPTPFLGRLATSPTSLSAWKASESSEEFLIAPSILAADFANLGTEVDTMLSAGADVVHFDVMDNHYGESVVAALSRPSRAPPLSRHLHLRPAHHPTHKRTNVLF